MSALDLPLSENDSGADTLRGYLRNLLWEVWVQEEGFSGKRPFGNSGWQHDLFYALREKGVKGTDRDLDQLVREAIWNL